MKRITILGVLATVPAFPAFAIESGQLDGKAKFALDVDYMHATSNAMHSDYKSTSVLHANIAYRTAKNGWGQEYELEAFKNTDKSHAVVDVERYRTSAKAMRYIENDGTWLSEGNAYYYGKLQAERDLVSNFKYMVTPTVGYGKNIMHDQVQRLNIEVGIGTQYFKEEYSSDNELDLVVTLGGEYRRELSDTVELEQDIDVDFGSDVRTIRARTGVLVALADNIDAQASYQMRYTDTDSMDTRDGFFAVGVRYSF